MAGFRFSGEEKSEIWRLTKQGLFAHQIAQRLGRSASGVQYVIAQRGGVAPKEPRGCGRYLSLVEREEISRGLKAGDSLRTIAGQLGRPVSTVSREVRRNGGREKYRAVEAQSRAGREARRPKPCKLVTHPLLRAEVEGLLRKRWSPQQISARLKALHPNDVEFHVSHETIYQSLFVQGRGALKRELTSYLRSKRTARKPRSRLDAHPRIADLVPISERPAEAEDRAVPGHWEGDLIIGRHQRSAIATLVERSTRYVMLVALPDGYKAPMVRAALTETIQRLPASLWRTLTWDRGHEMAQHVEFSVATGVKVFFCDPHSPWQRGTNENTNGLLRDYLPKATDLSIHCQADLDAIADELNERPRQTLGWQTPAEKLAELVGATTG
jgi:IS30 family transposase